MFSHPQATARQVRHLAGAALCALAALGVDARGGDRVAAGATADGEVLTSFEQIWALPDAAQQVRHRVRLDYEVYYYDPQWRALWGRSGDERNYLSLGADVFPIKAGQRIRVEGTLVPAQGMRVDHARVSVIEEAVSRDVVPTAGDVGNAERFNKRLVTVEGCVDRIVPRDANHVELRVSAEGRPVVFQVLLPNDAPMPQLKDATVRATGVYFARNEPGQAEPKIEIWVQSPDDLEVVSLLERDPRFELPATPVAKLDAVAAGALVRVAGRMEAQEPGRRLRLNDGTGAVQVQTAQTRVLPAGAEVEAIGRPVREGSEWVLRQGLYRSPQSLVTSTDELYHLPAAERTRWHRVRLEQVVYFYDPVWKVLWGRCGDDDDYLSIEAGPLAIKPGQRLLIEGFVQPINGMIVRDPKVAILAEGEPLEVLTVDAGINQVERYNKRLVVLEGYVDRLLVSDPRHLQLDLVVDGRPVTGRLLLPDGTAPPQVEGALVRAKGVYSATSDPAADLPVIELWMQGPEDLAVTGWLKQDERFQRPVTPVDELGRRGGDPLVKVAGMVRAQEPGRSLTIRDDSGQVVLHTAQAQTVSIGERVEAIGRPVPQGAAWALRDGLFRMAPPATAAAPSLTKLRVAEQLRELSPEEAARGYAVQLTGVVTWTNPAADFFFLADASGGVCVYQPPGPVERTLVGMKVEVSGVSAPGRFMPVVMAGHVRRSAQVDLPAARPVTLDQALTGVEEAQWVGLSGYARDIVNDGPWTRIALTTAAGEFVARLPADAQLAELRGAVLRLRGVCSAVTNDNRQLTGIQLWVPSPHFIEVEESLPTDPFTVALRPIAALRQFNSLQTQNRRVRVSGVVVHRAPGRSVHLQEDDEALLVLGRDPLPLEPGDRIEAVGFPGRENGRVVLREAVFRRIAPGRDPAARPVAAVTPVDVELDGNLVRTAGTLLDIGAQERGVRLIVQTDRALFEALLDERRETLPAACVPGSRIELTGVYQVQFDEERRPHAVQLLLRSPADIRILQRPPWWTVRRALAVTGILAVVAGLGLAWVVALRRRVRDQIGVIGEQLEKEKAARLEAALARASKLESLGVLAGGIAHDFNNLLTVVMGNLSLARLDRGLDRETQQCLAESERAAVRARDLTQQLLTFAKGGQPVRAATSLGALVCESAQFALHGSKVRAEFDLAADLWPADVDKGQIGQVVHNIVINACQAMPAGGEIRIVLRNEEVESAGRPGLAPGRYVRMSFADSGVGIDAEHLARIFEPYFTTKQKGTGLGLATVHSIVLKHQGHVDVQSHPGQGTTFRVWLPAAVAESAPLARADSEPAVRGGRVLVMDDEAAIRQFASIALKRMGLDVTAVSDGAAVEGEFTAAREAGRPYDLVILDLTVPGGMGGAEAMERLRRLDPGVRAIVSSGYSSDPVMAHYRDHGFRGRVPKPYQIEDLEKAVRAVLNGGTI